MKKLLPNVASPLVIVLWVDSSSYDGWKAVQDVPIEPMECLSVGWVMHDNDTCLVLAPHAGMTEDKNFDQVCGYMAIPRPAIKQVEVIQKANCRKSDRR